MQLVLRLKPRAKRGKPAVTKVVVLAEDCYALSEAVALVDDAIATETECAFLTASAEVFEFDPRNYTAISVMEPPAEVSTCR